MNARRHGIAREVLGQSPLPHPRRGRESDIAAYPLRHEPSAEYKRVRKLMGPDGGKIVGELN